MQFLSVIIFTTMYFTFIFMDTASKSNTCAYYDSVIAFVNLINVTMIVKVNKYQAVFV